MADDTKFVLRLLGAWLCLAAAMSLSGALENVGAITLAVTVWSVTGFALICLRLLPPARDWLSQTDARSLILPHLTRFVGAYFLWLAARGQLPTGFARPAGLGDLIVALFAVLILVIPALHRRRILLLWNWVGLVDIVFVVFSALRFGMHDRNSMAPLRNFPLVLLPIFIVPIVIVTHILIFVWISRAGRLQTASVRPSAAPFLQK